MTNEGLVAPVWSDAGAVPVGEVKYTEFVPLTDLDHMVLQWVQEEIAGPVARAVGFRFKDWKQASAPSKPDDPNAKPALPALTKVSGNKRGPGWCDE